MKTIFLVDDSATILLSMSAILSKAGYTTEKAASAEEGMTKLKGGLKPDLLITDLNMPGMNGIEFINSCPFCFLLPSRSSPSATKPKQPEHPVG